MYDSDACFSRISMAERSMFPTEITDLMFSAAEVDQFQQDGFIIQRGLIPDQYVNTILEVTRRDASSHFGDIEYEADVLYPGAPESLDAEGGRTIRRLRQAFSRDPVFSRLVKESFLLNRLKQLLGPQVVMPLAHHNCVMTKHPRYSSDTGWHQDTRFWAFTSSNLVNTWLALGDETLTNGCLRLLPGSHRMSFEREQLDEGVFLREDLELNRELLDSAVTAELSAGDVLFFHARCFHAATRNYSDKTKYSAVFTFRSLDNPPLPESRSSRLPELLL
jgi:phytanoyl-CoA hydroxylase